MQIHPPGVALVASALLAAPTLAQTNNVEITWDARGVPYVSADSDAGVFFGQGYSTAVDQLALLERVRMASQGRLAELIGQPTVVKGLSTLEQDLLMRHLHLYEYAAEKVALLDAGTKSALEAYSAGINEYVDALAAMSGPIDNYLTGPIAGYETKIKNGEFEPWTATDTIAVADWWGYWSTATGLEDAAFVPGTLTQLVIDNETCIITDMADFDELTRAEQYALEFNLSPDPECSTGKPGGVAGPRFSDGWITSQPGGAIHHVGPKLPILNPSLFHEVHLHNTDALAGYNVRGVALGGAPGLMLGFNEHLTWGSASLDADTQDLIVIEQVASDPSKYMLDGEELDYDEATEDILSDDGTVLLTETFRRTVFGPVVTDVVVGAAASAEYALSSTVLRPDGRHTLQASLRMLRARDVDGFREACKYWTTPNFECLYGDDTGEIGFTTLASIPTRGDQSQYAGFQPIANGGDSSEHWTRIVPFDYLPWTTRSSGHLFMANNRPAGCWYPIPMLLSVTAEPSGRWLRLWQFFEGGEPTDSPLNTVDGIAEIAFDPVVAPIWFVFKLGYEYYNDLSPGAQNVLDVYQTWWGNGNQAKALYGQTPIMGNDPWELIAGMGTRFDDVMDPELAGFYGVGKGGSLSMFKDAAKLNYDLTQLKPDGVNDVKDEVLDFVQRKLGLVPGGISTVPLSEVQIDTITHFGFNEKFGGEHVSLDPSRDVSLSDLLDGPSYNYADHMTFDKNTLWSAQSKVYSHTVDLGSGAAGALHPTSNVESPAHPTVGAFFEASVTDLWVTGEPAGSMNTHFDELESADLIGPAGTPDQFTYQPDISYYGIDYGGADPLRGVSIQANAGPYTPGTTLNVLVSNLPTREDFLLDEYAPSYQLEYEVQLFAGSTPAWTPLPDGGVKLVDEATPVMISTVSVPVARFPIQIPPGATGRFYVQAIAVRKTAPPSDGSTFLDEVLVPDAQVTTMGMWIEL
ncbi:MAG: penicillin acylase family protein [Planctomycetota bacterium]